MDKNKDPRAELFAQASRPLTTGLIAEEQLGLFHDLPPEAQGEGWKSWYHRGNNFVLAYSTLAPGGVLERVKQPDEYVVYLPNAGQGALIEWEEELVEVQGGRIAFVPAGASRITLPEGGEVIRLFTILSGDLADAAPNAQAYLRPRTHIPPFKPWPAPNGGWKVRHYPLDVPDAPGRFGRIYRCTTFMVNPLPPQMGPRDPARMSPHHHDDFEQCSLALQGTFTHHLRWPWTTDMKDWQDDRHISVASPSALVIPPPVIHTTRATGAGRNDLVDIFCPPRMDFSLKPGWVLNADDYPMPDV